MNGSTPGELKSRPTGSSGARVGRQTCSWDLQLWQLVTLKPFDIQNSTVNLWKDLEPVVNILSAQETGFILKISFALSNWPYLHRAYVVTVCRVLSTTAYIKYYFNLHITFHLVHFTLQVKWCECIRLACESTLPTLTRCLYGLVAFKWWLWIIKQ